MSARKFFHGLGLMSCSVAFGSLTVVANTQAAEASPEGGPPEYWGIGAVSVPEYEGASEQRNLPFLLLDKRLGPVRLESTGNGLRLHVFESQHFAAGVQISARWERKDDLKTVGARKLRPLDFATELGGFLQYQHMFNERLGFSAWVSVTEDVSDVHGGRVAETGASWMFRFAPRWMLTVSAGKSWGDDAYMQTYFGIDADNARRSGLRPFQAEGGIKDAHVSATLSYGLSPQTHVLLTAGVSELATDIAASPLVKLLGDKTQASLGVGAMFMF